MISVEGSVGSSVRLRPGIRAVPIGPCSSDDGPAAGASTTAARASAISRALW
jgi:hypothetical protein